VVEQVYQNSVEVHDMLIIGKHSLASFLRVFVDVLLIVNILVLIFLPWQIGRAHV